MIYLCVAEMRDYKLPQDGPMSINGVCQKCGRLGVVFIVNETELSQNENG